jgi:quinol-cytochrome oxidoreductase complex cytochrome b subunit
MNYSYKKHEQKLRRQWWIGFILTSALFISIVSGLIYFSYVTDEHINKDCDGRLINCFTKKEIKK